MFRSIFANNLVFNLHFMKVSTENDNNLGYGKIAVLVDNKPLTCIMSNPNTKFGLNEVRLRQVSLHLSPLFKPFLMEAQLQLCKSESPVPQVQSLQNLTRIIQSLYYAPAGCYINHWRLSADRRH